MPRKKKEEVDEGTAPEQVRLNVTAEHIAKPHSIELRRNGGEFVIDAQMNDHAHRQVIGAMTVEDILRTQGLPFPEGGKDVVLTFSPHNGEIIAGALEGSGEPAATDKADDAAEKAEPASASSEDDKSDEDATD